MGETVESDHNASFWLPTHFLTDEDFLPNEKPNLKNHNTKSFELFSGGFDPFGLDSPVSSSENESEEHQELLAELTRQLAHSSLRNSNPSSEKPWLFSTSPQSTLTGLGPWSTRDSPNGPSQAPSPPLTPPVAKNDAAWELLYEAAGQVARLKMNSIAQQQQRLHVQNRGLLRDPKSHHPSTNNCFYDNNNQFQAVKRQSDSEWYGHHHQHHHHARRSCGGGALGLPQSAWPALNGAAAHHHHHRQQPVAGGMRAVFLGGSGGGVRKSAGTGVFLPRRPGTHQQPEPRKKPTGGAPVLLPARVVQALNLNVDEMNNGFNLNSHPRFGCGFGTDHEMLLARRNSQMMGQQRSLRRDATMAMGGHNEVSLPSDWTY